MATKIGKTVGESRPHWALAADLGKELALGHRFASGREVFAALGPKLGDDCA